MSGMDSHIEWPTAEIATLFAAGLIQRGDRVLDMGCGLGTEAIQLGVLGCDVVAIDKEGKPPEGEEKQIDGAQRRLDKQRRAVQRRVDFIEADARTFREGEASTFHVVIDRLLLHNRGEGAQCRIVRGAAYAIAAGGIYVVRCRRDRAGEPPDPRWAAEVLHAESTIEPGARDLLDAYFDVGPEVPFAGLITDPTQATEGMVVRAMPMSLIVAVRNDRRFGRPKSDRP